jgi:hypothetical protein
MQRDTQLLVKKRSVRALTPLMSKAIVERFDGFVTCLDNRFTTYLLKNLVGILQTNC